MGRRGLGAIDDSMLGSVANKVLMHVRGPAVCLVGDKPRGEKILIGLDNSWGAMRAANFVGKMLNKDQPSSTLAHVVRFPEEEEEFSGEFLQKLQDEAQEESKPTFEKVTRSLTVMGINPSKIRTKVITGVVSRSTALLNEARNGRYGTIVIGRKGITEVEDFQIGRVGFKLVQAARDKAVWVIS